jgi:photosystem II stability/assembly factor-like uncharacterized protein
MANNKKTTNKGKRAPAKAKKLATVATEKRRETPRERGPRGWFLPVIESAYTDLRPRSVDGQRTLKATAAPEGSAYRSMLQRGLGEEVLRPAEQSFWLNRLAEFKNRKTRVAIGIPAAADIGLAPPAPSVPGGINWAPLGPSVVLNGQAEGEPPVAGRIPSIAVAPGGMIVYAASANGGVFRSDDGGVTWRSLMDAFDLAPTNFASTSLACGAIAIDRNDPNRVYVGTGEGDTYSLFKSRIVNALPAYRGVGPIRSDDGGATWISEPAASGSTELAGKAFFALAVDPKDRENVVGATSEGLYQRVVDGTGNAQWFLRRSGVHSSVIATSNNGVTKFFAAQWSGQVLESSDGNSWRVVGTGFPNANVGRIEVAAQIGNPDVVYAFIADTKGLVLGVYRFDAGGGQWSVIANPPDVLPKDENGNSQGDYDLALAVDPNNPDLIYLGGSYFNDPQYWPASIWRCQVTKSGSAYQMTAASIGVNAHADVHTLIHSPGDSNSLWAGCDGGLFLNRDPRGTGIFKACNNGLSCLCSNFFGQHPTDPGVLFCGLQDNGTARGASGGIWKSVNGGDGGYCLINWKDPLQVLVFANGSVYRATDGGQGHDSWTETKFTWATMTEPMASPPYNPANADEASLVALGSGRSVHFSTDFGDSWLSDTVDLPTQASIYAITFASGTRLYVGTTGGEVFRVEKAGNTWQKQRVDNVSTGALPLQGLICDIAIDWVDSFTNSIYIAFGGTGDYRHVWHFDGTAWEQRSGPAAGSTNLLDVEHNAIVVDRQAPTNVYVGADIGVWHSSDKGQNWAPLSNGLPEAPVFDLQIHPTKQLLRASTHGRGLYEFPL